ncbi:MAG: tetratricopeptide repeat protein [Gemmatimonadaceae bacterium]
MTHARALAVVNRAGTRLPGLWVAGIALVACATFANALANGFAVDDRGVILENPGAKTLAGAVQAFARPYWPDAHGAGQYRPLVSAHFALDWVVSSGRPWWFHAVNVAWHAAAAVMVTLVAAMLVEPAAALAGGLIFAVHPVHVEAVANVVGRAECMAAFFVLAALLAHRRGHSVAALALLAALASKESGIVFIGLALAHDVLLTPRPRTTLRERRPLYALYAAVVVVYAAALMTIFRHRPLVAIAPVWFGASVGERLLTMAGVVPEYGRLLLIPLRLSVDYHPRVIELATSLTPAAILGGLTLVCYLCAIVAAGRAAPRLAFALLVIPIAISPVANVFFPSGVALAERTLYLPSVGVALLVALGVERALHVRRYATVVGVVAVAALLAARSWSRTPVWHDNRTVVVTALAETPESYKVHQVAARVLSHTGNDDAAQREYAVASSLFGRDPGLYREAAEIAVRRVDSTLAVALLDTALALLPGDSALTVRRSELRPSRGERPPVPIGARRAPAAF